MRPFRTTPLLCALLASCGDRPPGAGRGAGRGRPSVPPVVGAGARPRGRGVPRRARAGARRARRGRARRDRRLLRRARLHAVLDRAGQPAGVGADRRRWRRPATRRCRPAATTPRASGLGAAEAGPAREVALTRAYLAYAGDLSSGVIDPSAVDDEITRKPVRPSAAVLLAPLADAPVAEALAGLEPADPDYRRLVAEKRRLEAAGADRELGAGGAGRPDAASRGQRPARRRAARPAGPPRLPRARRRDGRRRASTRRSRRRSRRSRPTTASSTTGSSARRRSRRSTRRSRRGWRRSRSTSSAPLDAARSRRALPLRQHPRLHRDARRGRQRRSGSRRSSSARRRSPRPPSSPTR